MYWWETKIEIRKLERPGYCHCCGKEVEKNDETMIVLSKCKGQDMYYLLCFDCLKHINETVDSGKTSNNW